MVAGVDQLIQIAGALMILTAFAALQFGRLTASSRMYLALNLVGSAVLSVLAWYEAQWGFLLLETVWSGVSAWGLWRVIVRRPPAEVAP